MDRHVVCFHFSSYSVSFQARAQWTAGKGTESHGERQVLYQHRVTVISVEIEGLKLGRRQQLISHQTRRWSRGNSPELTSGWSSLWTLLCVQRTQGQLSLLLCFTLVGSCCLVPWHTCGHTAGDIYSLSVVFAESHFAVLQLQAELDHCLMFPLGSKNCAASRNAGSCRLRDVMVGLLPIISF